MLNCVSVLAIVCGCLNGHFSFFGAYILLLIL